MELDLLRGHLDKPRERKPRSVRRNRLKERIHQEDMLSSRQVTEVRKSAVDELRFTPTLRSRQGAT